MNELTDRGIPPTPAMLYTIAADIAGKRPGRGWPARFVSKYAGELKSGFLAGFDSARKKADTKASYEYYFELVKQKMQQYDVQACDTYNMDEKGFLISFLTKAKRIFLKDVVIIKRLLSYT